MKRIIFIYLLGALVILFTINAFSATFKYKNGLVITSPDLRTAAMSCYKLLTNNKYPGEETGLEIIDTCANPKESN